MLSNTAKVFLLYTLIILICFFITLNLYLEDLKKQPQDTSQQYELPVYKTRHKTIVFNKFIHNDFDLVGVEGYLQHFFPDELFASHFIKTNWIDGVNAMLLSYKNHYSKVELFFDKQSRDFDVIFTLKKNNRKYYFADGRMLLAEKRADKHSFIPYYYAYPSRNGIMITKYPLMFSDVVVNMERNYDFYFDLYGHNRREINANLDYVTFGRFEFPINSGTECFEQTKKVYETFRQMRQSNEQLNRWFNSIKSISSFSYRVIANTARPSMHTFAIAMDILTRDSRPNYWYWSSQLNLKWWQIPKERRAFVPDEVIETFEQYGFCWGGKWERFDIMHFEYKPENLYKKIR